MGRLQMRHAGLDRTTLTAIRNGNNRLKKLHQATGIGHDTLNATLQRLRKRGVVRYTDAGGWAETPSLHTNGKE
jgi:DNA-binding IclR family transcriptional regulator